MRHRGRALNLSIGFRAAGLRWWAVWCHGQGKIEGRPFSKLRLDPDVSPVMFDNLLTDGQAQPGTRIGCSGMQALKNNENLFGILWVDADTVVAYCEAPSIVALFYRDVQAWRCGAVKLERIADEILQQLPDECRVTDDSR